MKRWEACFREMYAAYFFPRVHIGRRINISLWMMGRSDFSADRKGKQDSHPVTLSLCCTDRLQDGVSCSSALCYSCWVNERLTAVCCRLTASLRNLLLELETLTPVWLTDSVRDTQHTAVPHGYLSFITLTVHTWLHPVQEAVKTQHGPPVQKMTSCM